MKKYGFVRSHQWAALLAPMVLLGGGAHGAYGALSGGGGSDGWRKHVVQPPIAGVIQSAVAGDLDGDGNMDVLASLDGKVVAFKGPEWRPHVVYEFVPGRSRNLPRAACIHSCLMDVDGDGDEDFIGSNNTVFWLETPPDPFAGAGWIYRTIDDEILGTHCLITGDVNQDGRPDLIANSFRDDEATVHPFSIAWLEIPPDPRAATEWPRHIFADRDAPGGNHYMGFGDVNGDGRPDISCGAKGGEGFPDGEWFAWWEQPEDATTAWKKRILAENQPGATNINPADVNNDGVMDFVATRGHGRGVLWFQGPDFEMVEIDPEIDGPHSLIVEDLDDDGDIDIATCGRAASGEAVWYANDGQGRFTRHTVGTNQGAYDLRTVDMDRDGDLDLLIAGNVSGNIVWYENPRRND